MTSEKRWFEPAQRMLERVLAEAEADRRNEYDGRTPYLVERPKPLPPELAKIAHLIPDSTCLSYKLEAEAWDDEDDEYSQCWDAVLTLPVGDTEQMYYLKCENVFEKILANNSAIDGNGNKRSLNEIIPTDIRARLFEAYIKDVMDIFFYRLKEKLETSIIENSHETYFLASVILRAKLAGVTEDAGAQVTYGMEEILEEMKHLLVTSAAARRRSLRGDIDTCLGEANFVKIGMHYKKVLSVWQDAKLIYKQNCKRANWRDLVRAAHPNVEFDDDLLSRLSGKLNDLPEEVQAKLSEKGGDSKPSSIALEHAARLCGSEPYQYSLRHLYNIKNEMRRKYTFYDEEYGLNGEESDS